MASTRNNNTRGNYELEQDALWKQRQYELYLGYRMNQETYLPGDGLLPARCPMQQLFAGNCDAESRLLGIGSTNLVTPSSSGDEFDTHTPSSLRNMKSLSIIDKPAPMLPEPLVVAKDQRFMTK